jgi:DNA-binding CsgD family transcriptional regulator
MFWDRIAQEIENNRFIPLSEAESTIKPIEKKNKTPFDQPKKYILENNQPNLYLTFREAQCMAHMMLDCTMKETAQLLGLSPRTVEYYIKRIKTKIGCRTKESLIKEIQATGFAKTLETNELVDRNAIKTALEAQKIQKEKDRHQKLFN